MSLSKKSKLLRIVLAFSAILVALQPAAALAIAQDPNLPGPNANSWTLPERAKQWALAQAFGRCIAKYDPGGGGHNVTESELAAGNWFSGALGDGGYTAPSFLSGGDHNDGKFTKARSGSIPRQIWCCTDASHCLRIPTE